MATTVTGTVLNKSLIAIAISSLAINSVAGEFSLTPSLKVEGTYTDNVELTEQNKKDSFVTQLGVLLDAQYNSQYANFSLKSDSTYASYSHDHEIDDDFNSLQSNLNVMLWPNGISFYAQANIDNRSRNSARNSLADIVSGDLVRVNTYATGLSYIIVNSDFELDINSGYQKISSEDNLGENEGIQHIISTRNGRNARNIFWDANANYQDRENRGQDAEYFQAEVKVGWISGFNFNPFIRYYDENNEGNINQGRSLESNSYGIGLRWLATPRLYIDLSYNRPIDDEQIDLEGNELDDYYDISVDWQPTSRTQLQFSRSQRFYGDSYSFNFSHKIKRVENIIGYNEQVQTFTRNSFEQFVVGNYWCPATEDVVLTDCYIATDQNINFDDFQLVSISDFNVIEDQSYRLFKTLNWSTVITLPRGNVQFGVVNTRNINLDNNIEDKNQNITLSYTRRLSGKSDLTARASYVKNQFQIGQSNERKDDYRKMDIEYSKTINSTLKSTFGLSYLERESDTVLFNYEEQRVYLQVVKEF